jgi:hypothetical protein
MSENTAEKSGEGCVLAILLERLSSSETGSAWRLSEEGKYLSLSPGMVVEADAGVLPVLIYTQDLKQLCTHHHLSNQHQPMSHLMIK